MQIIFARLFPTYSACPEIMQFSPWTDTMVRKENILDNSQVKPITPSVYTTDEFSLLRKNYAVAERGRTKINIIPL